MKNNGMKTLMIALLVITVVTVVLTLLIVAKLTHSTSVQEETSFEESFSGTLYNAYLYEDQGNKLIVFYEGKNYVAHENAKSDYTGVADIEITNGKITKIYAKSDSIEGILDSYSDYSVQIKGYEELEYENLLPVYVIADNQMTK